MLTRRTLLLSSLALSTLALAVPLADARAQSAQVSPQQATQLIDQMAKQLIAIIDSSGSADQKRPKLQQIVDTAVAVDTVGQFCLGRYWRTASPDQQRTYLQLFHSVLLNSITGHLGDYKGITYTMGRATPGEGGMQVPTTLTRPGQAPADLIWIVGNDNGPKIVDVIAAGTSLRLTQRSDYDSYLSHNGGNLQALLTAMRRQVGKTG